ncbi:MAG: DUF6542 domain-containing protein [Haloechinothrix sp.]
MTATRDRANDLDDDTPVPWDERAIAGSSRGIPWWGAIAMGLGLAVLGAAIDLQVQGELGLLFQGCYFVGAVAAVCWVRRGNLFTPMVQPPLVLAVTVPGVVLYASGMPEDTDTIARVLAVGNPLINGFPTMAVTTAVTLVVGVFRIIRERDPEAAPKRPAAKAGKGTTVGKQAKKKTPMRGAAGSAGPTARGVENPAAGGRRARAERHRAQPLEPREPRATKAAPDRRRAAPDHRHAAPDRRQAGRDDDPDVPRRTSGQIPRGPITEGTPPPPPPRRTRVEPGDQPQRRTPIRRPPPPSRPWERDDPR